MAVTEGKERTKQNNKPLLHSLPSFNLQLVTETSLALKFIQAHPCIGMFTKIKILVLNERKITGHHKRVIITGG